MIKSSFVGFKKYIKVNGVGYKITLSEENKEELIVHAGFTHLLKQVYHPSLNIKFTRKSRMARIRGASLSILTNTCSSLRNKRKPNVFTGKGIRFRKEKI
jgi:ribosomal protein L6P/L9E